MFNKDTPSSAPVENLDTQPLASESRDELRGAVDERKDFLEKSSEYRTQVEDALKAPFSSEIHSFLNTHSPSSYSSYAGWNEDFCVQVLGEDSLTPQEQIYRVAALQIYLDGKVGGFTKKPDQSNSFDGKFGPFTMDKLIAYTSSLEPLREPDSSSVEGLPSSNESIETYTAENTFYVGDSYGEGFTAFGETPNKNVQVSRPFYYQTPEKKSKWKDNDVLTHALAFLNNPACKKLVVIGGLNDFGKYNVNPEHTANLLQEKYEELFDLAEENDKQIDVFDVPITPKHIGNPAIVSAINRFNVWLADRAREKPFLHVSDTDSIVAGRWNNDLHPTSAVYRDMFESLNNKS